MLVFIAFPVIEVFALVEVAHAIGWRFALLLLIVISVIGVRLTRVQGRALLEHISLAVSERRAPGVSAIDSALSFLGAVLLAVPGFVTDLLGVILLLPPTRSLARRSLSRRYTGRVMRFAATTGRFATSGRGPRPADVESWAVEEDIDQLER